VSGGGDFGGEGRIARVVERLSSVGVEAVHRVPGFVRQGKDMVLGAVPVHQNDWRFAVDAPRVGSGPLALRFVPVDPAGIVALPKVAHVVIAERTKCLQSHRLRLGDGVTAVGLGRQGDIEIVHLQLVDPQQAAA
jgi:hypothetical protein